MSRSRTEKVAHGSPHGPAAWLRNAGLVVTDLGDDTYEFACSDGPGPFSYRPYTRTFDPRLPHVPARAGRVVDHLAVVGNLTIATPPVAIFKQSPPGR